MLILSAYVVACIINPSLPIATVYLVYQYPTVAFSSFVIYKMLS